MDVAQDALRQLFGEHRVVDDHRAFGVVVLAAWVEVVRADHTDAAVHHQRFGVQAHTRALPSDRHRAVGWSRAQERRPRLGTQHFALHFAAAGRRFAPRTTAAHVAARRTAADHAATRRALGHVVERRRYQLLVVHRCIQRERLVLVDVEAQLTQVAALVLVGQRIDHRVVGRRQAVGGNHHTRR
ncbi:hypothetical protein D3C81_1561200 [compost metagenome]